MKHITTRFSILVSALLLFSATAYSQGANSRLFITTYTGYSFGLTSEFENMEFVSSDYRTRISSNLGLNLGLIIDYRISNRTLIGAEFMMQNYDYKSTSVFIGDTTFFPGAFNPPPNIRNGFQKFALVHIVFGFSETKKESWSITLGAGYYEFIETGGGVNFGLMHRRKLSPHLALIIYPRIHFVAAGGGQFGPENQYNFAQLSAGLQFSL